ncbi:hypothetical protein CTAYLR_002896 [Chrysophaeum taylorii]|uniref:cysteine desulfurase n=1 Tax=Chrysophaeum taylorii TaxID=2483200 RepID=A0AAD7UNE2_9STRA|nr:hypothetical protein CTAYLR_002896 [Chrysophaeum taylorii]
MRLLQLFWGFLLVAGVCSALVSTPSSSSSLGAEVRAEFPVLAQEIAPGKPLIYLDSGATSQKPQCVLDALHEYYVRDNANVHRGAHTLATRATEAFEEARGKVARFVGGEAREIVWTRGATEAVNLVAHGWGDAHLEEGDEIVLTVAEHHANLVPWQLLASRKRLRLKYARLDAAQGAIDADHLASLVTRRTRVVAMVHVSNVLGSEAPVAEAVRVARERGAPDCVVLLDACQSVPHKGVDVRDLGVDFLVASGHKMCGPTGIGFLWGKYDRLEAMQPWQGGGEMIDRVTLDGTTYAAPPARFEAGTPAIAQAVALGTACDFLSGVGMDRIAAYERRLARRLDAGLRAVPGVRVYGPSADDRDVALVAFNARNVHASDLAFFLDQEGVATRAGHHCCQPLHHALDADAGTVRASLALYNTPDEIDAFLAHLRGVLDFFADLPTPADPKPAFHAA